MTNAEKAHQYLVESGIKGALCPPEAFPRDLGVITCNLGDPPEERLLRAAASHYDSPAEIRWKMEGSDCPGMPCSHREESEVPAGEGGWLFITTVDKLPICPGLE